VSGRWHLITDGGSIPTWIQTRTLNWAANLTINGDGYSTIRVPIQGDTVLNGGTGVDGQKLLLELTQDGAGNHSITLGSNFQFGSDFTSITFSVLPGMTDYVGLVYNATANKWRVVAYSRGYA
jgi:hypothetical protein